ncbi:hypothetical protein [Thalassobius sp. I31.1]|nr:hypothetical protein [Thalassobius sp. I31.1]
MSNHAASVEMGSLSTFAAIRTSGSFGEKDDENGLSAGGANV